MCDVPHTSYFTHPENPSAFTRSSPVSPGTSLAARLCKRQAKGTTMTSRIAAPLAAVLVIALVPLASFAEWPAQGHSQRQHPQLTPIGGQVLSLETLILQDREHLIARALTAGDRPMLLDLGSPDHLRQQQAPLFPGSTFE